MARGRRSSASRLVVGSPIQRMLALHKHSRRNRLKKPKPTKIRAGNQQQLLPGIPQDVVVEHIIPRLPFYQRPLMMAVSRAWRAALQSPESFATRSKELLNQPGLILCHDLKIKFFDVSRSSWHLLPPPPVFERLIHLKQDLYSVELISHKYHKLDISSGLWRWQEAMPVPERDVLLSACYGIAHGRYIQYWSGTEYGNEFDLGKKLGLRKGEMIESVDEAGGLLYALVRLKKKSGECLISIWQGQGACLRQLHGLQWKKLANVWLDVETLFALSCC